MAVYQDIAKTLEQEIHHQFTVGEFLPSETELARRFAINRHTVRRAIDELAQAGLVLKQQGRGTMIVNTRIDYSIRSRARFTETLELQGLHPSCELLNVEVYPAPPALAESMAVPVGVPIVQLDTLRRLEGQPLCLIRHHLNARLLPDIENRFRTGSLHQFIEAEYGIRLRRRQCTLSASLPSQAEATLLCCARSLPLIELRSRNTPWEGNETVEYSLSRSRSDRFEVRLNPENSGEMDES